MKLDKRLSQSMQNCMVFAARYAHHRQTGAALQVVSALRECWPHLDDSTKTQILSESLNDATECPEDWAKLECLDQPKTLEA